MTNKRIIYYAVLLPLLIIILLTFIRLWYLQRVYPRQDFIYAAGSYGCLELANRSLFPQSPVLHQWDVMPERCTAPQLYVYHFRTQTSVPITLAQAQKLNLSPERISHDGFIISPDIRYFGLDIWPFGGPNFQQDFVISKGNQQRRLHLTTTNNQDKNFQFIAWMPETSNDDTR
jgi:hypothetical protein